MEPLTDAPPDAEARQQVTALFEAHALGLVKLATVMLGDQSTAEDVVQDAFAGMYRKWASPRPARMQAGTVAPAVAGIPRYYAIATEGKVSHDGKAAIKVTVGDVRTGKTLATVALPAVSVSVGVNAAVGVSAAGNDRAFVVGRRNIWGAVTYFLVRIAPGAKQVGTVEHVPIPDAALGNLLGFAVSPDGKELAVLSVRGNGPPRTWKPRRRSSMSSGPRGRMMRCSARRVGSRVLTARRVNGWWTRCAAR